MKRVTIAALLLFSLESFGRIQWIRSPLTYEAPLDILTFIPFGPDVDTDCYSTFETEAVGKLPDFVDVTMNELSVRPKLTDTGTYLFKVSAYCRYEPDAKDTVNVILTIR